VTALARGINCVGGYYQAEYLPAMQRGTVQLLARHSQYSAMAGKVDRVVTDDYLSGMQAVMFTSKNNELLPAGPVEIISAGGLTAMDLARISSLTVEQAHCASLFETLMDVAPESLKSKKDQELLIGEVTRSLSETCLPVIRPGEV
jgi:hypothetical protein